MNKDTDFDTTIEMGFDSDLKSLSKSNDGGSKIIIYPRDV